MAADPGQAPVPRWRPWLPPLAVLVVLAAGWLMLLPTAERSVFGLVPVLDEVYYLDRAVDPAASDGYFVSPLYPRLVALTGSAVSLADDEILAPPEVRGIRLLQIGCWLAVALLLYLTARRTLAEAVDRLPGGTWWCWLPSVLFVLYRPAAVYTMTILLELPLVFLVTLLLYLLTWRDRPWWPALLIGLTLGTAALLRGTVLVLTPVAAWALLTAVAGPRRRVLTMLVLLAAVVLPLLPATVQNMRVAGRPAGPTLNAGVNLFVGNGPQANGFYVAAVPGDWRRDPAGTAYLAERLQWPAVSLAEADSMWTAEALNAMKARPGHTAGLWLKKLWLHLQAWEIDQLTPLEGWAQAVPGFRVLLMPFGILVVLGGAGLASGVTRWPAVRFWAASLAMLLAFQSVFFVVSRYRLVLVPLLALLAVAGLARLVPALTSRRLPPMSWLLGAGVALLLAVPWGLAEVQSRWAPLAQANEARRWGVLGQATGQTGALDRAADLYRLSVAGQPDTPGPWLGLAVTLEALGQRQEARDILAGAILRVERNLDLRRMLVALMLEDDLRSDALVQAQALLRAYPEDAETLHNATVLLAGFGNTQAALAMAERLVRSHPTDPRGALDLGVLLARSGRTAEARAAFLRGLDHHPDHAGLRHNLDLLQKNHP
jgi:Flp pilus assembly protein TadD